MQDGFMQTGKIVHAFRTLRDLRDFVSRNRASDSAAQMKLFEVSGELIRDDGGKDGLVIQVQSFRRVRL
jgi:hypothetical protein